jgi:hypothetical protein
MSSRTDLKEIKAAMDRAHQIRSEAVFDMLKRGASYITELFSSYNPQKHVRR